MTNKLTREIDGHKFYSKAYSTKEDAQKESKESYFPTYEAEHKSWFNFSSTLGFQEDIHNEATR